MTEATAIHAEPDDYDRWAADLAAEPPDRSPSADELAARRQQILRAAADNELLRLRARRLAEREFAAEVAEEAKREMQQQPRVHTGGSFLLDIPPTPPALWGKDDQIIWARGEALMLGGPQGVGKTTIAGQLLRASIGLSDQVLGFPVMPFDGRVGYLAMDRPEQARRALGRMFGEEDRAYLDELLRFWSGPLMTDAAVDPATLVRIAEQLDVEALFIDSLKDAAVGLSKDEVGAGYNRARQMALAEGVQLIELHHVVKNGSDGGKPNNLNGLYGSTWLTAGAGSVVMLWGEAGDEIVELLHLKQPMADVGPFKIQHNRETGLSEVFHDPDTDVVAMARRCATTGLTVKEAAQTLFGKEEPSKNEIQKARRRLAAFVEKGLLVSRQPSANGRGAVERWFAAAPMDWVGSDDLEAA